MVTPLFIIEEEAAGFLPEGFLGSPRNADWQENAIMFTWMLLLFGYILSLAPILFVSFFFWILAVEWSLDSTLHFSMESFDQEDDDDSEHVEGEISYLMDRLQKPLKPAPPERRGILGFLHEKMGLLRFSPESFVESAALDPKTDASALDAPHVHHHGMPPLVKADWN
jgi:hypothetical protein